MRLTASALVFLAPALASALSIPLDVEFDDAVSGDFASVTVTEDGGELRFEIAIGPGSDLGGEADLHEFYFNLTGSFSGLSISSDDPQHPRGEYALASDPSVRGGAGSSFDFGVNFGNGGGPPGNGTLQTASFTLGAAQPLSIADLFETSTAAGGEVTVHFAAHFQNTSFANGSDSETVGGVIPEPGTGALLGLGLGILGALPRSRGGR